MFALGSEFITHKKSLGGARCEGFGLHWIMFRRFQADKRKVPKSSRTAGVDVNLNLKVHKSDNRKLICTKKTTLNLLKKSGFIFHPLINKGHEQSNKSEILRSTLGAFFSEAII